MTTKKEPGRTYDVDITDRVVVRRTYVGTVFIPDRLMDEYGEPDAASVALEEQGISWTSQYDDSIPETWATKFEPVTETNNE